MAARNASSVAATMAMTRKMRRSAASSGGAGAVVTARGRRSACAPQQPARTGPGVPAGLERRLARLDGGEVAGGLLHQAGAAGGQVGGHPRRTQLQVVRSE